jgi:hypothetical protein
LSGQTPEAGAGSGYDGRTGIGHVFLKKNGQGGAPTVTSKLS